MLYSVWLGYFALIPSTNEFDISINRYLGTMKLLGELNSYFFSFDKIAAVLLVM